MIQHFRPSNRAIRTCARYALPGLAAALALLLAAEWLGPGFSGTGLNQPPALPAATADAAADAAISQWGSTALARPLFSPSRRPDNTPGKDMDGALPRLSAIIITGGNSVAVFSANGRKAQLVNVGGEIGGYQLQRIEPDMVELRGPAGALTLHPQFAPAATPDDTANSISSAPSMGLAPSPPGFGSSFAPLPPATPASNPALYLEQNF